jgi:hypothetical protein
VAISFFVSFFLTPGSDGPVLGVDGRGSGLLSLSAFSVAPPVGVGSVDGFDRDVSRPCGFVVALPPVFGFA